MNYPVNILLSKINTREDAEHPQKEKYPNGTERRGLMWEHTLPKIGEPFMVAESKLYAHFMTSPVEDLLSFDTIENTIEFRTVNSEYRLTIIDEEE